VAREAHARERRALYASVVMPTLFLLLGPSRLLGLLLVSLFETLYARLRRGPARPTWDFRFEWVVRFLQRDFAGSASWPYARLRADLDGRRYPSTALPRVRVEHSELGGVPVVTFSPPEIATQGAENEGVVLFFHGGSYIFGSPRTSHADLIARLCLEVKATVIAPEYRLAPEHPYPAALDDARAVYEALTARTTTARIVLAGDSAGGNLALSLQLRLRDEGRPQARAALLISPWLDLSASRASCRDNEPFDYGMSSFLLRHARDFAGTVPLADARVSPLNAELGGLAPLYVQVGGAERLHDEAVELVHSARRAGVSAELDVVPDMPHNPPALAAFHTAAVAATSRLGRYVAERLAASSPGASARALYSPHDDLHDGDGRRLHLP
jgi:epsilon-lactone hydrolase